MGKRICLLLLFCHLLSGCTHQYLNLPDSGQILLSGSANLSSQSLSDTSLISGTFAGVYVLRKEQENKGVQDVWTYNNIKFEVAENSMLNGPEISTQPGKDYVIFSYSPFKESQEITNDFNIVFPHGTDVLWASSSIKATFGSNQTHLRYSHLMSQIRFAVEDYRSQYLQQTFPISGLKFLVRGFMQKTSLDLLTGKLLPTTDNNNETIAEKDKPFCIVPSANKQLLKISLTFPGLNGNEDYYETDLESTFISGYSYFYIIKVLNTGLDARFSIVDWESYDKDDIIIK